MSIATEIQITLPTPHEKQRLFIRSRSKRKVVRAGRRGGKTTGIAILALEEFLAGRRILYATPTSDQISKFWWEVTQALQEPLDLNVFRKNESHHIIELPRTTQRIRAKTAWNADTLRGDWADLLILDEYQLMSEDAWETVGSPMLLDTNGDAVFIYTPPSLHSTGISKARDPQHATKLFKKAKAEMELAFKEGRKADMEAFHFTSMDNPFLSRIALSNITKDMTALSYRQEILAEDTDDRPGALWKRLDIENARLTPDQLARVMPVISRIVVGVDPPGGSTECGIVTSGKGLCSCKSKDKPEEHMVVLEDASLKASPEVWASTVDRVYKSRKADRVLGEKNYGGDMVESTIRTVNKQISYKNVNATRGKAVRAEPVAAKYEQGKVHHVGVFPELEDEMCNWIPGESNYSPNRMDALVWAGRELMPDFNWEFS